MIVVIVCNFLVEKKIFMYLCVNLFCRIFVIYGWKKSILMIYCLIYEMFVNIVIYLIVCYLKRSVLWMVYFFFFEIIFLSICFGLKGFDICLYFEVK